MNYWVNDHHFTRKNMKIAIKPNLVTKAAADLLKRGLTVVYHKTSNNACPNSKLKIFSLSLSVLWESQKINISFVMYCLHFEKQLKTRLVIRP